MPISQRSSSRSHGILGQGTVTSRSVARAQEGTTYEASCYTDPLAVEHLTGSLSALIEWFGQWEAPAQLRFTTKYDAVAPLLRISHRGRTRMRASLNPAAFARHKGGTSPVAARLGALRRMAEAGYPIGLTIAPIIAPPGWEVAYDDLLSTAGDALRDLSPDLTVELITHRFTKTSKEVLTSWYPGSDLDMGLDRRAEKRTKFGSVKQVYDRPTMGAIRSLFERGLADHLPGARLLYFT